MPMPTVDYLRIIDCKYEAEKKINVVRKNTKAEKERP